MARVLLVGIEGFVGRHLAALLAEQGEAVHGLAWSGAPQGPEEIAASLGLPEGRVHAGDVTDAASLPPILAAVRPDAICHLAGMTYVPEANQNPEGAFRTNVFGTRNLLEAARGEAPKARFVFVSTADVYGDLAPEDLPITEATPVHPLNAYSISKAAAEMFCHQYGRVWGLPVIILRPLNHTGPGQDARFVCSDFARQVARIKLGRQAPVVRVGNLAAERDFADVRDIIRAYALAIRAAEPGEAYNLASGRAVSVRWVLDELIRLAGVKIKVETDPARMRPVDIPRIVGDFSKFEKATGWRPTIRLEQTLADLLDFWTARERS